MRYAIVIWMSEEEFLMTGTGSIYGWYEALGTALNTAVDMRRDPRYFNVQVVKIV